MIDYIIGIGAAVIVIGVLVKRIKKLKKGEDIGCGCGCKSCPSASKCHKVDDVK